MPLHLLKLAVGVESFSDLSAKQQARLKEKAKSKQPPELIHITRHMPKRADELLDGGSIYWVVKGFIMARQTLVAFRPLTHEGVPHCGIIFDPELVPVGLRPHRAFQGWRYFDAKDAPPDQSRRGSEAKLPEALKRELAALGLL
jgi:hypothetical protein